MYAVVEAGGKQYRVTPGDVIDVELRSVSPGPEGKKVTFDRVLLLGEGRESRFGAPWIEGAEVTGELVGEVRGEKIRVFKMKRRKGFRRLRGHRQNLWRVRIDEIAG